MAHRTQWAFITETSQLIFCREISEPDYTWRKMWNVPSKRRNPFIQRRSVTSQNIRILGYTAVRTSKTSNNGCLLRKSWGSYKYITWANSGFLKCEPDIAWNDNWSSESRVKSHESEKWYFTLGACHRNTSFVILSISAKPVVLLHCRHTSKMYVNFISLCNQHKLTKPSHHHFHPAFILCV